MGANETAEYLAANERNALETSSEDNSTAATTSDANQPPAGAGGAAPTPAEIVEKQPPTASVQVQAPTVPGTEEANPAGAAEPVAVQPPAGAVVQEEQDEADVFEDPTPPQALEGRLAGLEPIIGYPQMSLSEAVSAGKTNGGLHFPKDKFRFTGFVAEVEEKLEAEIKEWQTRMQEYLVEVALQQQQQPEPQQQQTSQQAVTATGAAVLPAQNGAQHNEVAEEVNEEPAEGSVAVNSAAVRSSSQQRES